MGEAVVLTAQRIAEFLAASQLPKCSITIGCGAPAHTTVDNMS